MFQFPGFALPRLCIHRGVTGSLRLSFLIQKSSDRRLFASFPRLIAGYHVFRRLSMPRHPPYTLSSLTTFIDHRHGGFAIADLLSRLELTAASFGRLIQTRSRQGVPDTVQTINNGSISPKRCSTTSFTRPERKNQTRTLATGRRERCREDSIRHLTF